MPIIANSFVGCIRGEDFFLPARVYSDYRSDRNLFARIALKAKVGNWSSSEAIWLLPSQIRTCGFPAYGSSRRYPETAVTPCRDE